MHDLELNFRDRSTWDRFIFFQFVVVLIEFVKALSLKLLF